MNKTAIKNFAIWARNKMIADVSYDARLIGITEDGIAKPLPQSFGGTQFFDIGTAEPYSISSEAVHQRDKLIEVIQQKEKDTDYKTAYQYVIEEVAYTWFNRLIAIRFMEVNDYLPSHIRVLSSESGKLEPDLVTTPFDAELPFTAEEEAQIFQLKQDNKLDEVFRILFLKQCNALNEILPALFEKTKNYTELLLSLSVTNQDGVVYHLIHDIPEDDFNIERGGQVEIIGWLYQYYNTEPKAAAFAKNGKITKEEIPAVTQLFTPDWIVRYMVENSLGRLFIDKRKNEGVFADGRGLDEMTWDEAEEKRIATEKQIAEQMEWKYYLPEAVQTKEVREQLDKIQQQSEYKDVRDIKVIDPCMGSGHILVYAFDVLMQLYEDAGYSQRDAAKSILENNLYGLDIDDRAYQLAYFAVMMKARQYNRRILNGENTCHVYAIQESNSINRAHLKYFGAGMDDIEKNAAKMQLEGLLDTLTDAKEYGSILNVDACDWDLLRRFVEQSGEDEQMSMDSFGLEDTKEHLWVLIDIGQTMAQKYDVVVTNPPYMAISSAAPKLNNYVNNHYIGGKTDLFSAFIEKCLQMTAPNMYTTMITQQSWMFLTSFEKIRNIVLSYSIANMAHLGARGFDEISGEVVQTTSFVIRKTNVGEKYKGTYSRLIDGSTESEKKEMFISGKYQYISSAHNFIRIPESIIAYWVSDNTIDCFEQRTLEQVFITREGMATADNERFLRLWHEVNQHNILFDALDAQDAVIRHAKWVPYNKGGTTRDWYGNNDYVVDWENDGVEIRNNKDPKTGRIRSHNYNGEFAFKEGLTWSAISSGDLSVRYCKNGFLFDSKGAKGFAKQKENLNWILGLLNSKIAMQFLQFLSPTLDFKVGDIISIPFLFDANQKARIDEIVGSIVRMSQIEWDSFESSWDFVRHPLAPSARLKQDQLESQFRNDRMEKFGRLSWHYENWRRDCEERFNSLKSNEEELNRIFIGIYGLQNELTPEVEEKDVTVRKADLQRDIKSLLSYAVGCMFGRYSIYKDGLLFAGEPYSLQAFVDKLNDRPGTISAEELQRAYRNEGVVVDEMFFPDADNVIPITDEEYLDDDIVSRLCAWLKAVYGADTLEANLDYIAKALGNKGSTSREIIRNYFLNDFFKDHCQTYSVTGSGKRPIYWLFDSGKQNGFKALVYLHRYTPDTIGNLRIDYLHKMQRVYESEINRMQDMMDHSENAREAAAASKRKDKLAKQLKECREYDEKISHLALSRIELDLDDGVKVNYRKLQTAQDGKFYEVLADSKNIMAKEKK